VLDDRKTRMAIGSLVGSFGSLPGGLSALNTGDSIMPESSPMIEQKVDLDQLLLAADERILSHVKIVKDKDQGTITIGERALFYKNSHILKASEIPLLDRLGRYMSQGEYPVDIIGYTDNRPGMEKGYKSNHELSGLMAIAIVKYFVKKDGIKPERLIALGRGDLSPVAPNSTPQSRAQNRRVEIILNYKAQPFIQRRFSDKPSGIFTYKRFHFRVFD